MSGPASGLHGAPRVSKKDLLSYGEAGVLLIIAPTTFSSEMPRLTRPTMPALVFAAGLLAVNPGGMSSVHPLPAIQFCMPPAQAMPLTATLRIRRSPSESTQSRGVFAGILHAHPTNPWKFTADHLTIATPMSTSILWRLSVGCPGVSLPLRDIREVIRIG